MKNQMRRCGDCGTQFPFTSDEQRRYEYKGFKFPKRCKPCRDRRRANGGQRHPVRSKSQKNTDRLRRQKARLLEARQRAYNEPIARAKRVWGTSALEAALAAGECVCLCCGREADVFPDCVHSCVCGSWHRICARCVAWYRLMPGVGGDPLRWGRLEVCPNGDEFRVAQSVMSYVRDMR